MYTFTRPRKCTDVTLYDLVSHLLYLDSVTLCLSPDLVSFFVCCEDPSGGKAQVINSEDCANLVPTRNDGVFLKRMPLHK